MLVSEREKMLLFFVFAIAAEPLKLELREGSQIEDIILNMLNMQIQLYYC